MFLETARFYDLLYSFKDYPAEAARVESLLAARGVARGSRLLDAACGTGAHLAQLAERFEVEGFDLDEGMLEQARRRLPNVPLHRADLVDVDLGRRFAAVTCLFSSIAYVGTPERLDAAVASLAAHLEPGGVLLVEPWIAPEEFRPGSLHVHSAQDETRAITRLASSSLDGRDSILEMHYLLADGSGVRHAVERHVTTLFTDAEYRSAFEKAGLSSVEREPEGLMGRGIWLGSRES